MPNIRRLFSNIPDYVVDTENEGSAKRLVVDPDLAYPALLKELAPFLHLKNDDAVTQYALEVARRCFTEDLKRIVKGPIVIQILAKDKKWALRNFPSGPGASAGANNFRLYYGMIRKGMGNA